MNSILQCLSNTPELRDYCLGNIHRTDVNNSRTSAALMEGRPSRWAYKHVMSMSGRSNVEPLGHVVCMYFKRSHSHKGLSRSVRIGVIMATYKTKTKVYHARVCDDRTPPVWIQFVFVHTKTHFHSNKNNILLACFEPQINWRKWPRCGHGPVVSPYLMTSPTSCLFLLEFARLTQSLWTSLSDAISPFDFKSQIQRYAPKFVGCK